LRSRFLPTRMKCPHALFQFPAKLHVFVHNWTFFYPVVDNFICRISSEASHARPFGQALDRSSAPLEQRLVCEAFLLNTCTTTAHSGSTLGPYPGKVILILVPSWLRLCRQYTPFPNANGPSRCSSTGPLLASFYPSLFLRPPSDAASFGGAIMAPPVLLSYPFRGPGVFFMAPHSPPPLFDWSTASFSSRRVAG